MNLKLLSAITPLCAFLGAFCVSFFGPGSWDGLFHAGHLGMFICLPLALAGAIAICFTFRRSDWHYVMIGYGLLASLAVAFVAAIPFMATRF